MIYIALGLILLGVIFDAYQDDEVRDNQPNKTWVNKYAKDNKGKPIKYNGNAWWYFGLYKPTYKERFPFSTTWLVTWTDNWHLYGSLRDWSYVSAGCIAYFDTLNIKTIIWIVGIRVISATVFHILFVYFLNKIKK
jgi:hypothetical protein